MKPIILFLAVWGLMMNAAGYAHSGNPIYLGLVYVFAVVVARTSCEIRRNRP